jgi:phage-related protein
MSSLVFPALPGLSIEVVREPYYSTKILRSVSGREVRAAWRSQPKVRYSLRFNFARTSVQAPGFPAYSEIGVLMAFLDQHLGAADSFLYADPYTGSSVRVRFVEDSIQMAQIVPGVWSVDSLQMETVF